MSEKISLNEENRDLLQELGNIGSGNAVTALSQMLDERLELSLPQCKMVADKELGQLLQDKRSLYVGVVLTVEGDLQSMIALLLNREFVISVLHRLTDDKDVDVEHLTELQKSALCELGNIMCNSYYTAISSMVGKKITVSVPHMLVDKGERILKLFVEKYVGNDKNLIFVRNNFFSQQQDLESHILLYLTPTALDSLWASLM